MTITKTREAQADTLNVLTEIAIALSLHTAADRFNVEEKRDIADDVNAMVKRVKSMDVRDRLAYDAIINMKLHAQDGLQYVRNADIDICQVALGWLTTADAEKAVTERREQLELKAAIEANAINYQAGGELVYRRKIEGTDNRWVIMVDRGEDQRIARWVVSRYIAGSKEWVNGRYMDSRDDAHEAYLATK